MKLSQIAYKFDEPIEIEIKDPETGKSFEKPAFIKIISVESEAGKKIQLDLYREVVQTNDENKEVDTRKYLAKLITGWRGIEDEETGKEIPFSYEQAVNLLENPIIFQLVNKETAKVGNFKK